jgi:hypothetical protein
MIERINDIIKCNLMEKGLDPTVVDRLTTEEIFFAITPQVNDSEVMVSDITSE